jgi:hypothetical protein
MSLSLSNAILRLARAQHANVIIAHRVKDHARSFATVGKDRSKPEQEVSHRQETFSADPLDNAAPMINDLDVSTLTVAELAQVINSHNAWMVISAYAQTGLAKEEYQEYNSMLSMIRCPLLLVPELTGPLNFERLSYLTDLRYCQMKAIRFLSALAKPYHSDLLLAHRAAKGLPDMDEQYANALFKDTVSMMVGVKGGYLSNIREKQIGKVLDVLIHGLKTQMLALVKDHHHYEETFEFLMSDGRPLMGESAYLIFPC